MDVIVDDRVFHEDFVPSEVVHRHDEVSLLSDSLEPLLANERPETSFLFGPTGVGKTCIARYTVDELRKRLPEIRSVYINCWQEYTRFRVLYSILDDIGRTVDIHRSTPKDELYHQLSDLDDVPTVIVLDEVDQLEDTAVLYDLHRLPQCSMVLIANREEELFARFDDRVRSRLRAGTRIRFDRYGTDELVSILDRRAEVGLAPGAISTSQLRTIADTAAGDARVGIGILRSAARRSESDGRDRITDDLIDAVAPSAKQAMQRKTVEELPDHQRVLYDVIAAAGEIAPKELYAAYEAHVDKPKTHRMLRNYLSKMAHYGLIEAVGENRGRTYRIVDADGDPLA